MAARARELGIVTLQPARLRDAEAGAAIGALRPRLGVLADYGQIVPPAILELFESGILNLHPSLLPRQRGASPIPAAILDGDRETGVTAHPDGRRPRHRPDRGAGGGASMARERPLARGACRGRRRGAHPADRRPLAPRQIAPRPQGEEGATLTRPLRRDDGLLDPTRPAVELERQVRAFRPWPGTYVESIAGRIAVLDARAESGAIAQDRVPGRLGPEGLCAAAGSCLALRTVQPAGGRAMSWEEFLRGRPGLAGSTVIAGHA